MKELLLNLLNFIDFFGNVFVLLPLLVLLYLKKKVETYRDGMIVIVQFVLFFMVIDMAQNSLTYGIKQEHVASKVEEIKSKPFHLYVDNELYKNQERSKKIVALFEDIQDKASHRAKNGSLSKPRGDEVSIRIQGAEEELNYSLVQDNGWDYEYWVYDNHDKYLGRIDTTLFLSGEKAQKVHKEMNQIQERIEKNIDQQGSTFMAVVGFILMSKFKIKRSSNNV